MGVILKIYTQKKTLLDYKKKIQEESLDCEKN